MAYSSLSRDTVTPGSLTLQDQRLLLEKREKQIEAEYNSIKNILEGKDQNKSPQTQPPSSSLDSANPSVESELEQEQKLLLTQIAEHNELQFAVQKKEGQLQELELNLKGLESYAALDPDEETTEQVVRQLENCQGKMNLKVTEAEKIYNTYLRLQDHLLQELREMPLALDKLHHTVSSGQSEVCRLEMMSQSAVTTVDSTKSMLMEMKGKMMEERKCIEKELTEVEARKAKEVEGRMVQEKVGEWHSNNAVWRTGEKKKQELRCSLRKEAAEQASPGKTVKQSTVYSNYSRSLMKVEDGKTVSSEELQEWESRKTTKEHMLKCENLLEQLLKDLQVLELEDAQLKFSSSPDSEQHENLMLKLEEDLGQQQQRCNQWKSRLSEKQALLQSIERGINNLYYRVTCVGNKDKPSGVSLEAVESLKEISDCLVFLETLIHESVESQDQLDQDKVTSLISDDTSCGVQNPGLRAVLVLASGKAKEQNQSVAEMWGFLEQSTLMEPKNYKCVNILPKSPSTESLTVSSEEDCSPTREDIKRQGLRVIKNQQPKNKGKKTFKGK